VFAEGVPLLFLLMNKQRNTQVSTWYYSRNVFVAIFSWVTRIHRYMCRVWGKSSVRVRCVKLVWTEVCCRREQHHALTVSCIDCERAQTKTDFFSASSLFSRILLLSSVLVKQYHWTAVPSSNFCYPDGGFLGFPQSFKLNLLFA
jgi:hypothetical protein